MTSRRSPTRSTGTAAPAARSTAAREGGTAPCVLNAANEIAVHAFLRGRLAFLQIPEVIERTLDGAGSGPVTAFESLYDADRLAREIASETVAALA